MKRSGASDSLSWNRGSGSKLRSRVGRCRCSRTFLPASFSLAMDSAGFSLDRDWEKLLRTGRLRMIWLLSLHSVDG